MHKIWTDSFFIFWGVGLGDYKLSFNLERGQIIDRGSGLLHSNVPFQILMCMILSFVLLSLFIFSWFLMFYLLE